MHTIEYEELSRTSREIGDQFYKCLSQWLKDPMNATTRRSCIGRGHDYEKALVQQIEYLQKLKPSARSATAIEACQMYHSALESQLQMLESAFKRGN